METSNMAKTLKDAARKVDVAEIVHHGEQLILPTNMSIPDAINLLERRQEYLGQAVEITETFDVFPWDGAYAFSKVLEKRYGWAPAMPTGWFGSVPPKMINIEIAPGVHTSAPWGKFSLPGINGTITCEQGTKNGRTVFALKSIVLRMDEESVRELFDDVRSFLAKNSIYRGKAIKLRFRNDDGEKLATPEPKFLNTNDIDESMLVYSDDVMASIATNLFTPIERANDCIKNGIPLKRGVLLGGTYGTGKTLAAKVASKKAVDNGITYIYVPRADELADAIEFGVQYQSPACVIFCEDVDRVMAGERDVEMDDILNIIDGIDTKSSNIITVLTTNDLESINAAMLRPGRLDAVIEVTPPDAKAVQQLLRVYGGKAIKADTSLESVGVVLAGTIPATIAEVVSRAKLSQLRLQAPGTKVTELTEEALLDAAKTMTSQNKLLHDRSLVKETAPTIDTAISQTVADAVAGQLGTVNNRLGRIEAEVKSVKSCVS